MTDDFYYCPYRTSISQCKKEKCGDWNTNENDCNINVVARMRHEING
jgi:hypothetical protein